MVIILNYLGDNLNYRGNNLNYLGDNLNYLRDNFYDRFNVPLAFRMLCGGALGMFVKPLLLAPV